jgi:hypothetical protein
MKPLARWTIGCVLPQGVEILRASLRSFQRLHPEFDRVVCWNNLRPDQLAAVSKMGTELREQKPEDSVCVLQEVSEAREYPSVKEDGMAGWGWKLAPPRLKSQAHELWIDNDIVFRERLPIIDRWLNSDKTIISMCPTPFYGAFDSFVNQGSHPLCAGFFGLPPYFDFTSAVLNGLQVLGDKPLGGWNEQGLVSSIVSNQEGFLMVPLNEMEVGKDLSKPLPSAIHFAGVNRTKDHRAWSDWQCYLTL